MQKTIISWANTSWNPVGGCSKVSDGCKHCYAMTLSARYGWTTKAWTVQNEGENVVIKPHKLHEPYLQKDPVRVFVNSMSDLHHRTIPDWYRAAVWCVMLDTPQHVYQVLTKRSEALPSWNERFLAAIQTEDFKTFRASVKRKDVRAALDKAEAYTTAWADNIWQGVSIEDGRVLKRIPDLQACGAQTRFISAEPLLGAWGDKVDLTGVHWIIVGGESGDHLGKGQNPDRWMKMEWAREIRDLCVRQGVAYFFKQSSGVRTEMNPFLVETDGSKWTWHQFPNTLTDPVNVDTGEVRPAWTFVEGMTEPNPPDDDPPPTPPTPPDDPTGAWKAVFDHLHIPGDEDFLGKATLEKIAAAKAKQHTVSTPKFTEREMKRDTPVPPTRTLYAPDPGDFEDHQAFQEAYDEWAERGRITDEDEIEAEYLDGRDNPLPEHVAIIGSRDYPDLDAVRAYVNALPLDTVIVSGGARGVDQAAEQTANARGMKTLIFPADWTQGRGAGFERNGLIIADADRVVAFWDGKSRGTKHSIDKATAEGLPVEIISPPPAKPITKLTKFHAVKDHYDAETQSWDSDQYVYIGRYWQPFRVPQSVWHNPFKLAEDTPENRRAGVAQYRRHIEAQIKEDPATYDLEKLRGKTLVCFCTEDGSRGKTDERLCHGHVLLDLLAEHARQAEAAPMIPALSLYDPWGSLIALDLKRIETRGWKQRTTYRGDIVIHVGKRWTDDERDAMEDLIRRFPEIAAHADRLRNPPLGCAVAVAHLVDCVPTEQIRNTITPLERAVGGYDDGRWGLILDDVRVFPNPIPMVGQQANAALAWRVPHPLWKPAAVEASTKQKSPEPLPATTFTVPRFRAYADKYHTWVDRWADRAKSLGIRAYDQHGEQVGVEDALGWLTNVNTHIPIGTDMERAVYLLFRAACTAKLAERRDYIEKRRAKRITEATAKAQIDRLTNELKRVNLQHWLAIGRRVAAERAGASAPPYHMRGIVSVTELKTKSKDAVQFAVTLDCGHEAVINRLSNEMSAGRGRVLCFQCGAGHTTAQSVTRKLQGALL